MAQKPLKTSSRIALQFSLFTAASTLLILLCINVSFFLIWHGNDRDQLARMAIQQNHVQAFQVALQQTNKRYIMPMEIRPMTVTFKALNQAPEADMLTAPVGVFYAEGKKDDIVNYTRKLIDIIHANDDRWYMVYHDQDQRMLLLDITENVQRQIDLAWLSVIILVIMITLSYRISRRFVLRGLKDLYRLADEVQAAHIENLHTKLTMQHLPEDDEINIVA